MKGHPPSSPQLYIEKTLEASGDSLHNRLRLPPGGKLLVATFIALCFYIISLFFATQGPWFGLQLAPHDQGIQVVSVTAGGPSENHLSPGDILTALRNTDGHELRLSGDSLSMSAYDDYGTYESFNHFFQRYAQLFDVAKNSPVNFILSDGRMVFVKPQSDRPFSNIPWVFWVLSSSGILVFMIGAGVWVFRPDHIATRLVVLSALGYMVAVLSLSLITGREWLMPPGLLLLFSQGGHIGNMVYGYSAMVLFWYFPRPLGRFPMVSFFVFAIMLFLVNEQAQFIEWPTNTFIIPYFLPFILGIGFTWKQWINTRQQPDDRAALLWFVRTALFSITIVIVFYLGPLLIEGEPLLPMWVAQIMLLGLYIGVLLGVLRFRLFDLDRWWFAIWAWFLGGLLVVLVDLALVYFSDLQPAGALPISLLAIGWVYFPFRQWLWIRLVRSPSQRLEAFMPQLLETLFSVDDNDPFSLRWQRLLSRMFDPLHIHIEEGSLSSAHFEENGMVLAVPDLELEQHVLLSGRSRGGRLFSREDLQLVTLVHILAQKSVELKEAQEKGAAIERERIARDLHDDVAPQLLTLVHCSDNHDNAERARIAMQTLRESIYSLSDPDGQPMETVLADWRIEASERAEAAGSSISWKQEAIQSELMLTARQRLNLTRIMREVISNALNHAAAEHLNFTVAYKASELSIQVTHDGNIMPPITWRAGKGLNNMRTRIEELNGHISWRLLDAEQSMLKFSWNIPVLH